MTIKYVTPTTANDVDVLIDKAVKSAHKARELIQVAAVAIMIHAGKHGDYTKANALVEGLGNSANGAALVEWFKKYAGLVVAEDSTGFSGWQGQKYIVEHLELAKEKMWYDERKLNPFKGFDAEAELNKFIKKYNAQKKGMAGLSEEDKAKVSLVINEATIKAVLALSNFTAIVGDVGEATSDYVKQAA